MGEKAVPASPPPPAGLACLLGGLRPIGSAAVGVGPGGSPLPGEASGLPGRLVQVCKAKLAVSSSSRDHSLQDAVSAPGSSLSLSVLAKLFVKQEIRALSNLLVSLLPKKNTDRPIFPRGFWHCLSGAPRGLLLHVKVFWLTRVPAGTRSPPPLARGGFFMCSGWKPLPTLSLRVPGERAAPPHPTAVTRL